MRLPDAVDGFWATGLIAPFYRFPVFFAFLVMCVGLALWPAQKNLGTLMSCSAAVMLGTQFWQAQGGRAAHGLVLAAGAADDFPAEPGRSCGADRCWARAGASAGRGWPASIAPPSRRVCCAALGSDTGGPICRKTRGPAPSPAAISYSGGKDRFAAECSMSTVPQIFRIRQEFPRVQVDDVAAEVRAQLARLKLERKDQARPFGRHHRRQPRHHAIST